MYTWTRITRFKNVASMMAAVPTCVSLVEHMKKEYGLDATLLAPTMGGHPARVLFVLRNDDLQKAQDTQDRMTQDPKYRELVGRLGEFVDGSATNDQVWRTVV